jgi:hypothetical protein
MAVKSARVIPSKPSEIAFIGNFSSKIGLELFYHGLCALGDELIIALP